MPRRTSASASGPARMTAAAASAPAPATGVELDRKRLPTQARAQETCERILDAAASLLGEVGIERLSTNLVCERAGLTPPALYRYYPNKYAILAELGVRLMMSQNTLLEAWAVPATMTQPAARFEAGVKRLFLETLALTRAATAGEWITRALRAVPSLAPVRTGSHDHVTGLIVTAFRAAFPSIPKARIALVARLSVEVMYSAHELMFDDPSLDPDEVGDVMAAMVTSQVVRLRREARAAG